MKVAFATGKMGGMYAMAPTLRRLGERGAEVDVYMLDQHHDSAFGKTKDLIAPLVPDAVTWTMRDFTPVPDIDWLLLFGDRIETLLMASYAHNMDEPPIIAHVQGGDLTGGVDDAQRHAISKLANIHFCSTPRSAKRLEALGEVWERIYVVGDPHLDGLAQYIPLEPDVLSAALQKVGLGADRPYVVGMLHPDTMGTHLTTNMYDALEALGPEMQALVIHPCNDRGWQAIADRWAKASIPAFRWLPQETFGPLLAGAACVVGNSSMGIIEAPFLRTPTVNIGDRQQGRERGSLNMTVDVPSKASVKDIKRAIEAAVSIRMPGCVLYGAGQSHKLITEALLRLHPDRAKLRYKPQVMP